MMEFVIVTGLSGAGKSRAMNALEDIGFYCVDNIPPELIITFYDLCKKSSDKNMDRIAIVTDIRGGVMFDSLFEVLDRLKNESKPYKILFLDAKDDVLCRRYKETRRKHPLAENYKGLISQAIKLERDILKPIKDKSDYVIDTSFISPAQLKERISGIFLNNSDYALVVNCESFGFKYGNPNEADLVFDVRFLPNPFYIDDLKNLTGLDEKVRDYVMKSNNTQGFIERLLSLIDYVLPLYRNEGKSQLLIAIGCTGGKHRSVALTELVYNHILDNGQRATVHHRDIRKP